MTTSMPFPKERVIPRSAVNASRLARVSSRLAAGISRHHGDWKEVWLIRHKKNCGVRPITHDEAVEEAICFGWIDGQIKSIDECKFAGRFSSRRAKSVWSKLNRARAVKMIREWKMTKAGVETLPPDLVAVWRRMNRS